MKKLQNNFTTPEQSKRLLELGVPAWTADCYNTIKHIGKIPDGITYKNVWQMSTWRNKNGSHIEMYPCWSVGRLIEIYCLATGIEYIKIGTSEISLIELMIKMIEIAVKVKTFDFSRLEE